ncbi:MAG: secretion protein HlyD [Desulfovibrio sp.]|nr:secretion protein HlyD [Desulfovibrio sp.]
MKNHQNTSSICVYSMSLLFLALLLVGCTEQESGVFQGYVEGEYVHVSSPVGGTLMSLSVERGQVVAAGSPLFTLERELERAVVSEAEHGLQQAQDNLANLEKGQRPSEIASILARLRQATASSNLAKVEFQRRQRLIAEQTISQEELDRAETDYDQKRQRVKEIRAELETARLGARSDEVQAAMAAVRQASAKLEQALWSFDQKKCSAPVDALVFDTMYREGEWVSTGSPVVSLLPPSQVEVRFYVPQTKVARIRQGQKAEVFFDGIDRPVEITVSYVSPEAEYTPPVIYSSESRAKLVFLVKGRPSLEQARLLHPGQPVDVSIPELSDQE